MSTGTVVAVVLGVAVLGVGGFLLISAAQAAPAPPPPDPRVAPVQGSANEGAQIATSVLGTLTEGMRLFGNIYSTENENARRREAGRSSPPTAGATAARR